MRRSVGTLSLSVFLGAGTLVAGVDAASAAPAHPLAGQAGVYAAAYHEPTAAEATSIGSQFNITLNGTLDVGAQNIIYSNWCSGGQKAETGCVMTAAAKTKIEQQMREYVGKANANPEIKGFYLLDDYWGKPNSNIRSTLESVRSILRAGSAKPTYCAFSANTDYWKNGKLVTTGRAGFSQAVLNYTPKACDHVLVYSYTPKGQTVNSTDWGMNSLMPWVKAELKKRGWSSTRSALVGVPQAFNWAGSFGTTNAEGLRTQVTGFTRHGASAIAAFAWNGGVGLAGYADLSASADLRAGWGQGVKYFRANYKA